MKVFLWNKKIKASGYTAKREFVLITNINTFGHVAMWVLARTGKITDLNQTAMAVFMQTKMTMAPAQTAPKEFLQTGKMKAFDQTTMFFEMDIFSVYWHYI